MFISKHTASCVLAIALCLSPMIAEAAGPGCVDACAGYLRENVAARPVTSSRINAEAGALSDQFAKYLEASNTALAADKRSLAAERRGLGKVPAHRAATSSGVDSMPLEQTTTYYSSKQANAIAREIVSFQVPSGGWGKNIKRTGVARLAGQSHTSDAVDPGASGNEKWHFVGTIDNDATITEIRYLAKVQAAQEENRTVLRASASRGIAYLLAAQYPNGGWPQVYPLVGGYHDGITLNDDAMLNVILLLRDIGDSVDPAFTFIDKSLRTRCREAASRGIAWLIANQVEINGQKTAWGQQHDALTQKPTAARAYEMAAISSAESARILAYLMTMPNPDANVRKAVHGGVRFLQASRIAGKAWSKGTLSDKTSSSIWSRFYDLSIYKPDASAFTARVQPLFGDRPEVHQSTSYGLVFSSVASVSEERRMGYAQYNTAPIAVLKTYEAWSKRFPN
jgi:PelA/Pel-15E family pectate lyase